MPWSFSLFFDHACDRSLWKWRDVVVNFVYTFMVCGGTSRWHCCCCCCGKLWNLMNMSCFRCSCERFLSTFHFTKLLFSLLLNAVVVVVVVVLVFSQTLATDNDAKLCSALSAIISAISRGCWPALGHGDAGLIGMVMMMMMLMLMWSLFMLKLQ